MSLNDVSRLIEGGAMPIFVKARYRAPVLHLYGNIAELTRSGATSGIENNNGKPGGNCTVGGNTAFKTCL